MAIRKKYKNIKRIAKYFIDTEHFPETFNERCLHNLLEQYGAKVKSLSSYHADLCNNAAKMQEIENLSDNELRHSIYALVQNILTAAQFDVETKEEEQLIKMMKKLDYEITF